jgi:hypothetical protein
MRVVLVMPWVGLRATGKPGGCQRQTGNCDENSRLHLGSPARDSGEQRGCDMGLPNLS